MRDRLGMRRSDIMLVNIAVWVNSEKNLRSNISMWANYYTRHKQQLPFVIWRDASVQHFNTPTGLRNTLIPPLTLFSSPHHDAEVMCSALSTRAAKPLQLQPVHEEGSGCTPLQTCKSYWLNKGHTSRCQGFPRRNAVIHTFWRSSEHRATQHTEHFVILQGTTSAMAAQTRSPGRGRTRDSAASRCPASACCGTTACRATTRPWG